MGFLIDLYKTNDLENTIAEIFFNFANWLLLNGLFNLKGISNHSSYI